MEDHETDMGSSYRSPDPKKQLSVRIRGSVHAKLGAVLDLWRERATAHGDDPEEIDLTFVVEALLGDKVNEELAQWGGYPATPEQKAEQLKAVRVASKKQH